MLSSKSFLALDCGAGSLKLAEFEINEAGGLRLKRHGLKALGLEGAQEATREAAMAKGLEELLGRMPTPARDLNVCVPGFHVFSKFVKLPRVDSEKVAQIIRYEAQQNVPFPLDEVVWEYQILGSSDGGEVEVLLVAIKSEVMDVLFRVAENAGLRLQLADVSSAALGNAFRYNYGDLEGCAMLLDIGAKTSNLLFFEKGKAFSRSVHLGANSITQDFANEAKLPFAAAEKLKIEEGFVSLGGAYEEPEHPRQAQVSKIARQFMTRLHIQLNQTIQFYRAQHGGSAPGRLFLSGGASIMPYTSQFFAEKLGLPVEYFNPFRNVQIDPSINLDELAAVAHSFGEVVGLGLRNLARCPVELNLMPKRSIERQAFNRKKPYLLASVFSLAMGAAAAGLFYGKVTDWRKSSLANVSAQAAPLAGVDAQIKQARAGAREAKSAADTYADLTAYRYYYAEILQELRRSLIAAEQVQKSKIEAACLARGERKKVAVGVWVETFEPALPEGAGYAVATENSLDPKAFMSPAMQRRYHLDDEEILRRRRESNPGVTTINCVCKAVNLRPLGPSANDDLVYELERQLKEGGFFSADPTNGVEVVQVDPPEPDIAGQEPGQPPLPGVTFTFRMSLKLKRPLRM
jgi:type IV pilus assembly protein PilM